MYKFFTAVLRNEFSRPNWQPLVSLFRRINKTLEVILGSGVVALLFYLIYNYVPILDNKRWTAIVILSFFALAAMSLLSAAKRFYRSTLAEVYGAQEQTSRDLDHLTKRIELLTLLEGRSDALYFLLESRGWNDHPLAGIPIHKSEIQYHEADIQNTFRDRLGSTAAQEYFDRLGPIPEKLYEQKARIEAHRYQLHKLLQAERAAQLQINSKTSDQKQETLQRIEN